MSIQKTVLNNLTLKIISLIIAYGLWSLLNQSRIIQIEQEVPLCFYNGTTTDSITAPETISVTLSGKATDIRRLDLNTLACHINIADLHAGDNRLVVTIDTLFLPESINLLHYYPSNGCIVVHHHTLQANNKEQTTT
ncbi:MAG: hypothetical protein ACHQVS_00125 [Candidatus Babeliales bacterium]